MTAVRCFGAAQNSSFAWSMSVSVKSSRLSALSVAEEAEEDWEDDEDGAWAELAFSWGWQGVLSGRVAE